MGENSKWSGKVDQSWSYAQLAWQCVAGLHGKTFLQVLLCFGYRDLSWEAPGNFISHPPKALPPVVLTGMEEGKDSIKLVPLYTTAASLHRDLLLTRHLCCFQITMGFNWVGCGGENGGKDCLGVSCCSLQ